MDALLSGTARWRDGLRAVYYHGGFNTHSIVISVTAAEPSVEPAVGWVAYISEIAKTGYPQIVLLTAVLAWFLLGAIQQARSSAIKTGTTSSRIRLPYEICAQISRAAALAFIVLAAHRSTGQWLNIALVATAFGLGLVRLINDLTWRHRVLHQVNVLLLGSFLFLVAAELLPLLDISLGRRMDKMTLGALVSLAVCVLVALVTPREWMPPDFTSTTFRLNMDPKPAPEETASWLNYYWTYGWLTPTIWKGCKRSKELEMDDLPSLPWYDEPLLLLSKIEAARRKYKGTLRTIFHFQMYEAITMSVWILLAQPAQLLAPFGLYQLLAYLSAPEKAVLHPALWLFIMFIGPIMRSISFQQYIFTSTRLIVRVKSALVQELYGRAMSSMELEDDVINAIVSKDKQEPGQRSTSAGRLANLMSSDIDAIVNARDVVMIGLGGPFGTLLASIGLYKLVGWASFIGIGFLLCGGPASGYISQRMSRSQRAVKQAQDSRISLITEYLGSIKAIKYFGWEDAMVNHIQEARGKEQKYLWHLDLLMALMSVVVDLFPLLALVVTFSLYVGYMKQPLTAQVAFTTLSLILQIRTSIAMFGYLSRNITSAMISFQRLDRFFNSTVPLTRYPVGPNLTIKNATFRRNKTATFVLDNISIDFVQGGLNVVTGQSGSGKTTLLLAILGETILEGGSVIRPADVAFASQTTWLQSETIRDNIVFNSPFEQARYDRVVEACCLGLDFSELAKGDQTEVGENGTALSGGQKSRVALARALYSKAPLLLLDDIFSALDTKTAASVWKLCFCSDMLKGRTTVLVTQMPWVAAQADLSVLLENGTVKSVEQNLGVVRTPVAADAEVEQLEQSTGRTSQEDNKPSDETADRNLPSPPAVDEAKAKQDDLVMTETKASGNKGRLMFFSYMLHYGGPAYAALALFATLASNAFLIATSYWLSIWVDAYTKEEAVNIAFYLGIYAAFTLGSCLVDAAAFLIYANGQWIAAKNLHKWLINAVMNVSLNWWKDVPVGRVVNRLSRDIDALDTDLGHMLQYFIYEVCSLFFRVGAISSILPIFMVPGLVACSVGIIFGEMYTRTAVIVKRLTSSSQSPVFSQFSESMMGLPVIRARDNMATVFGDKLAERLRTYSRTLEANFNCNRWVAVRVDTITALVSLLAGMIAVSKAGVLAAGLVGFSLLNASGLSETILYLVRAMNELEVQLQSYHRVQEYVELEPEEKTEATPNEPPAFYQDTPSDDWPQTGAIEFRNVTIRYDPDGPDILKDVNLTFNAGERVAVVGRTGSGKSTLVLSLLHFTHIVSGQILYDGVDITLLPRKKLRQAITIIPQEAVLFNGTVKSNLDPSGEIPEDRLEAAIASCGNIASFQFRERDSETNTLIEETAASSITATESTPLLTSNAVPSNGTATPTAKPPSSLSLDTTVLPKGENFSHGQRQVLSLCRALVRKSSSCCWMKPRLAWITTRTRGSRPCCGRRWVCFLRTASDRRRRGSGRW